ncbi:MULTISPECIES: GNAT family N-acetyltransferase [Gammaproteobacteria]|uniref:GNAT family N-acetyltransferase n=1 Tax=Gammaproteobacteria TaxID=1236 RepID=UPI000DCF788F|nr:MULTISPECIES: GNAT family N-acetyltransferase [Gammaproteobacteria]RTE87747.1 tRNA(Met) cytidine acetyltransferase [Aliidiomarina sp. B3213]TCZ92471.1 tRNA(Met) cytidine acetyltransferase [Lysobacter sp. N42]
MYPPNQQENEPFQGSLVGFYRCISERNHRSLILWFPQSTASAEQVKRQLERHNSLLITNTSQFKSLLGTERTLLHCRFDHNWNASAWAACTATVVGKGVIIVEVTSALLETHSWQHLASYWNFETTFICREDRELNDFLEHWSEPEIDSRFHPTQSQNNVIGILDQQQKQHPHSAFLLYAARGRGKTSTLAHWCKQLPGETRVFISAPSKLQSRKIIDACAHLDWQFLAPEDIEHYQECAEPSDILIVDEAATLPFIAQMGLLQHPGFLVLATTTEGYEFAGRGFQIKYEHQLKQHFPFVSREWLHQPMRWNLNDPVEDTTFKAFALRSEWEESLALETVPTPLLTSDISYRICHAHELSSEEKESCFSLLVDAHYQTSPNDFKLLLDNPNQYLVLQKRGPLLIGVAWLSEEGPLISDLIDPITKGKRRPQGNLLPQTFCYYLKRPVLASMRHIRVVRIATHPSLRRKGLGYGLLARIQYWSKERNIESVGTSFGATPELIDFWQQSGYIPLRLGQKLDPASGRSSAVFVYPLTKRMHIYVRELSSLFVTELHARIHSLELSNEDEIRHRARADIILPLLKSIPFNERPEASQIRRWQELGRAFVKKELNFYDYAPWLQAALVNSWIRVDEEQQTLLQALVSATDNTQVAKIMKAESKTKGMEQLRSLCLQFHHSDV